MVQLEFRLSATGAAGVIREVKSVGAALEKQAKAAEAAASKVAKPKGAAARSPLKGLEDLGKLGAKLEIKRHQDAMRNIAKEEAAKIRAADKAAKALERAAQREAKAAQKARATFARKTGGVISNSVGNVLGGLKQLGGAAILGGGFAFGSAVQNRAEVQSRAIALANAGYTPGQKQTRAEVAKDVTSLVDQNQKNEGVSSVEGMKSLQAFVAKAGDLEGAKKTLPFLSRLGTATGSDTQDLGASGGIVWEQIKKETSDAGEQLKRFQSVMSTLAAQGKDGSIEMKDLASNIVKASAATVQFKGGSSTLIKTMGAFMQLAAQSGGAASPEEASTGALRLGSDIIEHQKKFKANNIDIFADKGHTQLIPPQEIFANTLEKTKGNLTKMNGLFGQRSSKLFTPFVQAYNNAERTKKGTGREAVMAEYNKFANANMSDQEIKTSADAVRGTATKQFEEAMDRFNQAIGDQLLPGLTKLIPEVTKFIPAITGATKALVRFADFAGQHPLMAIGGLIAADIAKAGIGAAVQAALVSAISASAGAGAAARVAVQGVTGAGFLPTASAGGLAATAGAAVAAGAGVYAAYDQADSLRKETGGGSLWDGSTWGRMFSFDKADAELDRQAKERKGASGPTAAAPPVATPADAQAVQNLAAAATNAAKKLNEINAATPNRGAAPPAIK